MKIGYKQTTKKELIDNYRRLIKELGHEPTALEIDNCHYLPTARQIQRRFGGLRALRAELGLKNIDFTSGAYRSKIAKEATERAKKDEMHYYERIAKKYSDPDNNVWVSLQYPYQRATFDGSYKHVTCDVCIEDRPKNHRVLIDFFSAKDEQSAQGSIRIKINKLRKNPPSFLYPHPTFEVVFVCLNDDINPDRFPTPKDDQKYIKILSKAQFEAKFLD